MLFFRRGALLTVVLLSGVASAQEFRIKNVANLPKYSQEHDYEPLMKNLPTRIKTLGGAALNYDELDDFADAADGKKSVHINPKTNRIYIGVQPAADPARVFALADQLDMYVGNMHCAPTSAAMILQYYGNEKFAALKIGATPITNYIHNLAYEMDSFGMQPTWPGAKPDGRESMAYMGTHIPFIATGMSAIAKAADPKLGIKATSSNFDADAYKKMIDGNRPPVVVLDQPGKTLSHVVVGIGYELGMDGKISKLILRDLQEADAETKIPVPKKSGDLDLLFSKEAGFRTNTYGDMSIATSSPFEPLEAGLIDFEAVPEPSSYLVLGGGLAVLLRRRRR